MAKYEIRECQGKGNQSENIRRNTDEIEKEDKSAMKIKDSGGEKKTMLNNEKSINLEGVRAPLETLSSTGKCSYSCINKIWTESVHVIS